MEIFFNVCLLSTNFINFWVTIDLLTLIVFFSVLNFNYVNFAVTRLTIEKMFSKLVSIKDKFQPQSWKCTFSICIQNIGLKWDYDLIILLSWISLLLILMQQIIYNCFNNNRLFIIVFYQNQIKSNIGNLSLIWLFPFNSI